MIYSRTYLKQYTEVPRNLIGIVIKHSDTKKCNYCCMEKLGLCYLAWSGKIGLPRCATNDIYYTKFNLNLNKLDIL